ncbi:hypothetical protein Save01_06449 [Streptomyces avermitilis]
MSPWRAALRTTAADGVPEASALTPSVSSSRLSPTTAARRSQAVRVVAREKPMSAGERPGPVPPLRPSSRKESRRSAWARSAASLFAESTHGSAPAAGAPAGSAAGSRSRAGACSMIVCALVPLTPKDETAARRGWSDSGHATASVSSFTPPADQST